MANTVDYIFGLFTEGIQVMNACILKHYRNRLFYVMLYHNEKEMAMLLMTIHVNTSQAVTSRKEIRTAKTSSIVLRCKGLLHVQC